MNRPFYAIGQVPPPVHGMAVAFEAMVGLLRAAGIAARLLDVSGRAQRRGGVSIARRCLRYLRVCAVVAMGGPPAGGYICVSGGNGQVFDSLALAVLRARGAPVFIHHHSFAYLRRRRGLAAWMIRLAGGRAWHIALGEAMAAGLRRHYGVAAARLLVISNAALLPASVVRRPERPLRVVGFLSNLMPGKGVETVLATARAAAEGGLELRFAVAGPCLDDGLLAQLRAAREVEWLGALYGPAKAAFFRSIDAFLFPTRYVDEAEPLVIWEALMNGVPVIAYDRGCIAGQVGEAGVVVPADAAFVGPALEVLKGWLAAPALYQQCAVAAAARFEEERARALTALERFIETAKDPQARP